MKKYKEGLILVVTNLVLSMFVVYLNPRIDILTLAYFLLVNLILAIMFIFFEKSKEKNLEKKIDDIVSLLHNLDLDSENYEIIDDEFGKLRDEIVKIILENKNIAKISKENQNILSEYIEDITHQIKTPLTGILLMVDLLEARNENSIEYTSYIRKNINRLYELSDILLKMAALDSGVTQIKKDEVYVMDMIDKIKSDLESYFVETKVDISIQGENYKLICDRNWTYEAVFNIVKNAIESTKKGRVSIELIESNISKSIIVRDFGEGMTDKMLKNAYKRFYKKDPESKGHGIGLPMAKAIMQRQNGELLYFRDKGSNYFELRFYI